jgi:hypothetical protein
MNDPKQRPHELDALELRYQELALHDLDVVNNHLLQFCSGMIVAATALIGFLAGGPRNTAAFIGPLGETVLRLHLPTWPLWFLTWFLCITSIAFAIVYLDKSVRGGHKNINRLQSIANGIHGATSWDEISGIFTRSSGGTTGKVQDSGSKLLTAQAGCLLLALVLAPLSML